MDKKETITQLVQIYDKIDNSFFTENIGIIITPLFVCACRDRDDTTNLQNILNLMIRTEFNLKDFDHQSGGFFKSHIFKSGNESIAKIIIDSPLFKYKDFDFWTNIFEIIESIDLFEYIINSQKFDIEVYQNMQLDDFNNQLYEITKNLIIKWNV